MPRSFVLSVAAPTHANEDAASADDAAGVYIVSDGVGRYAGAATASRLVVEHTASILRLPPPPVAERTTWLGRAAKTAAKALVAEGARTREHEDMCATLTALRIIEHDAHLLHVGDCRGYLLRERRLEQLTRDHSVAFEQFEAGAITKDELRTHPNQKMLTRTLRASSSLVIPEIVTVSLRAGDRLLLCTDGLTKELDDAAVEMLLASAGEPEAAARVLADAAHEKGADDDVTIVVVDVP